MSIKIQINSLEALERLLGDEETMEIDVRKSVIEAFGRGFVKSVYNSTAIKDAVLSAESAFIAEARRHVRELWDVRKAKDHWKTGRFLIEGKLHSDIATEAKRVIGSLVHRAVDDEVTRALEGLDKRTRDYIDAKVSRIVNKAIAELASTQAATLVANALKEDK